MINLTNQIQNVPAFDFARDRAEGCSQMNRQNLFHGSDSLESRDWLAITERGHPLSVRSLLSLDCARVSPSEARYNYEFEEGSSKRVKVHQERQSG